MHSLILVRHGEARHHIESITGGWTDTELTELGRTHSRLLGERLREVMDGVPVDLYCSDLRRAVQTAEILGKALDVKPSKVHELRDLNNGIAAGLTHEEARRVANEPSEPILDWLPYPQAESWRQLHIRIRSFMDNFIAHQKRPAVLVSHAAVIHVQVAWWLSLEIGAPIDFDIAPASITLLRLNRWGERTLQRLNDTAHLYADGLKDELRIV